MGFYSRAHFKEYFHTTLPGSVFPFVVSQGQVLIISSRIHYGLRGAASAPRGWARVVAGRTDTTGPHLLYASSIIRCWTTRSICPVRGRIMERVPAPPRPAPPAFGLISRRGGETLAVHRASDGRPRGKGRLPALMGLYKRRRGRAESCRHCPLLLPLSFTHPPLPLLIGSEKQEKKYFLTFSHVTSHLITVSLSSLSPKSPNSAASAAPLSLSPAVAVPPLCSISQWLRRSPLFRPNNPSTTAPRPS
jgi:hypothetical protein